MYVCMYSYMCTYTYGIICTRIYYILIRVYRGVHVHTYVLHGIKTYFKYNMRRYKKLNVLLSSSCVQGCTRVCEFIFCLQVPVSRVPYLYYFLGGRGGYKFHVIQLYTCCMTVCVCTSRSISHNSLSEYVYP